MADRLPDKGRRIKEQLHALQLTLAQHESAGGNEPPVERSQGALVVARSNEKPGDKARDGGSVVMPEAQRLPPHVVREMYASSASSQRLYGGRMTERRLETVNTVTSEAIESLHRHVHTYTYQHIYVCMYMCVPVHAYTYQCIYVCMYMCVPVHTYTYQCIYVCMYVHVCACTHIYIPVYLCMYVHVCACTYIYIPVETCTFMYIPLSSRYASSITRST
mgnify:CR=1 FL=1